MTGSAKNVSETTQKGSGYFYISHEKREAPKKEGGVATLDEALLPEKLLALFYQLHSDADNQLFKYIFQKDT